MDFSLNHEYRPECFAPGLSITQLGLNGIYLCPVDGVGVPLDGADFPLPADIVAQMLAGFMQQYRSQLLQQIQQIGPVTNRAGLTVDLSKAVTQ